MRISFPLGAALVSALVVAAPASATHSQPAPKPEILKSLYAPVGFFKPGATIPPFGSCKETSKAAGRTGTVFNPSGTYNAFDTNVFEVLCLPYRAAGDKKDDDPEGNAPRAADGSTPPGSDTNGVCGGRNTSPFPGPEAPQSIAAGRCPNHQLEYIKYYRATMQEILGPFGVTFRNYEFENPGSGNTEAGKAINPAAIVAGSDHPDENIIIGAHYDKTTEGPASVWDSQEGHAQIIRVAKIMADYWTRTGTRPASTIKFIPWDGEESGTLGSLDYTNNNIVPGEEAKVRGYWNTDPCAGGFPAFRNGNPNQRIDLGIQTARPTEIPAGFDRGRVTLFNNAAPKIIEDVFQQIDDKVAVLGGTRDVFISMKENAATADNRPGGPVAISGDRPVLFSSDWANFLAKGIPFFNPGPEVTGPSDTNNPNNPDGLAILHTPRDNFQTLNQQTGATITGNEWSDGWIKGMEMCSQLLAWGMLRADQGGAQTKSADVAAFYEALPNEASAQAPVTFDAGGTHQFTDAAGTALVDDGKLEYSWDFGDGTKATGRVVKHAYADIGVYPSKLTVRNTETGMTDTMRVPITVLGSQLVPPLLTKPAAEDADGTFPLAWAFTGPIDGLVGYDVEESADYASAFADGAEEAPTMKYTVAKAPMSAAELQPWQSSDSSTAKFRMNQRGKGTRGFWTGISPDDFVPAGVVQSGQSVLTLKEPIAVPAGSAQLTYSSLFQNEGDDRGMVEVALAGTDEFRPVDTIVAVSTAAGGAYDPAVCNPSEPQTLTEPLRPRTADLSDFAGKSIVLRFTLVLGAENRALSQPCGWYVDDIDVSSGTFAKLGSPEGKTFEIKDRKAGTYAYRIKALYGTGARSKSSNVESVKVTRADGGGVAGGAPPAAAPAPGATPGMTPAASPGTTTTPGATPKPGTGTGTSTAKPATVRAAVTRRVLRGGRVRIGCRLTGARARSCRVVVLAKRGGKLRAIKTVRLTGSRFAVVSFGKNKRLTFRGTVVSTSGKSFKAPTRSLNRR